MIKELEYAVIDNDYIYTPSNQKNAGLYTGNVLFDKKPWGNSFKKPPIEPDAVAYASQFYASHHIPSGNRPGNNTLISNKYKIYKENNSARDNYNFSCYDANQSFQQIQDISVLPVVQEQPPVITQVNNKYLFSMPNISYPNINNVNSPPHVNNMFNSTNHLPQGHHM